MKLTPLDIKRQEFKKTMRGYDPLEVETFLEMVANEYEDLSNERNKLKEEILTLQTQLKDYQQVEQTLKQTLMNAQESVNRARVNTEKEANLIIHEAELKAEKILEKARRDLESLKNELILIRAQKESFAKRLKHLLESQIELIKVLEIDDAESNDISFESTADLPGKNASDQDIELKVTGNLTSPAVNETEPSPGRARSPEKQIDHAQFETKSRVSTAGTAEKVDLRHASSVDPGREQAESARSEATSKLEEFLQKKEKEDLFNPAEKSHDAAQTEPFNKGKKSDSEDDSSTTETLEQLLEENSEEAAIKNDQSGDQRSDTKKVDKSEPKTKPEGQADLFKNRKKSSDRKTAYPDDDQMVF